MNAGENAGGGAVRVCAEAMFALNAAIDAMLLVCSGRLCGACLSARRVCAAAALGGVYAVLALVPALGFLQNGLIRLCVMALMLLLAFGWGRKLPRLAVMFLASGCAFAGLVFAMLQLTGTGLLRIKGGGFYPVSGRALVMLLAACCAVVRLLFSACAQHSAAEQRELTLVLGGSAAHVRALVDTGNTLKDPLTGEQVIVASWQVAARLLPGVPLRADAFRDAPELMRRLAALRPELRLRLIPYRAVGVEEGMLLAVRCRMEERGKKQRPVLVAFSPTSISGAEEYEALTGGAA